MEEGTVRTLGHVMILASAGSGKTYALTSRYVAILAGDVPPERIAALTFTRKAAGEFFDEIVQKLTRAAVDPVSARRLAAEIGRPELGAADFLRLLRRLVEDLHRLNLGTLDGFFARVVRTFPYELGLGGRPEVLEEHAGAAERRRVLRGMFGVAAAEDARRSFFEAYKRATFGLEEKRLSSRLQEFLDEHGAVFLSAPDPACWGKRERIWRDGDPWVNAGAAKDLPALLGRLRAAIPWDELKPGQVKRWEDFLLAAGEWRAGAPIPGGTGYVLERALACPDKLDLITVERVKMAIPPAMRAVLRAVIATIVAAELERRMEVTQGLHAVLHSYDDAYDELVRRRGRLSFADLQQLLQRGTPGPLAAESRMAVDWRLDAQIDHWLLDEFQDTSVGQWTILRNLIDEAVQDESGRRSFFYVGDIKQAIYTWREGDPRLFRAIFDHYNASRQEAIREERLIKSWRSGPAIIKMVNAVFGCADAMRRLFPREATEPWLKEWRDHTSGRPVPEGYAEYRQVSDDGQAWSETLAIIREVDPLRRGLDCAVLVQTNAAAAELADYLRREGGLSATAESDQRVAVDNPLASALAALFRAAAHPGDRAAWQLLRMTPLEEVFGRLGIASIDDLTRSVLGDLHAGGFETTAETWLRRLEPLLAPDDAFSRQRARQFVEAARLFDATGSRTVAEFAEFLEHHSVREVEGGRSIRVMTVHKAKGLGFDLVILPDLGGNSLASHRGSLTVSRARDRTVDWVLELPPRMIYGWDATVSGSVGALEAEHCFERFALLYVAMTRAKQAMYVIAPSAGTSKSVNFVRWLEEALGGARSYGDPVWYSQLKDPAPTTAGAPAGEQPIPLRSEKRRLIRARTAPSNRNESDRDYQPREIRSLVSGAAWGLEVHRLLAAVEWLPEANGMVNSWSDTGPGAQAKGAVRAPALSHVWHRPAGGPKFGLWRERGFDVLLGDTWVSGVFDRVVMAWDSQGILLHAAVFDFKAGSPGDSWLASRYRQQMQMYRRALASLLGCPLAAIKCELVWLASGTSEVVPLLTN